MSFVVASVQMNYSVLLEHSLLLCKSNLCSRINITRIEIDETRMESDWKT